MKLAWLTGMPRSGTTWISQFFAASPHVRVKFCPLFSYSFKNSMTKDSDANSWYRFFNRVYETEDEYMDQIYLRKNGLIPDFRNKDDQPQTLLIKSNRHHHLTESLLEKLPDLRMIALVRNPFSVINSWIRNPTEFPSGADPLQEWRSGSCRKTGVGEYWGFDDWKSVTMMHLGLAELYPDRFFIHRYEECARDPYGEARKMFDELEVDYSPHVDKFICLSRSTHDENPRSVYKSNNNTNKWRDQLDKRIVDGIYSDLADTTLAKFIDK